MIYFQSSANFVLSYQLLMGFLKAQAHYLVGRDNTYMMRVKV